MDELIRQIGQYPGSVMNTLSLAHTVLAVSLSFVLSLLIALVYRETHSGTSYSQSYVHTLIIMSVVTSLIMIIIGSNIARAFSLVGALSIIRFRSAIKETRDVAFIFLIMAIGMACGTRFYETAVLFTAMIAAIIFFLAKTNFGAKSTVELVLKILVNKSLDYEKALRDKFSEYLAGHTLLSVESASEDTHELVYSVRFRKNVREQILLDALQAEEWCRRVTLITGLQNVQI
jgi:uncharacterized membrane protein YhiD involved in acid resistance